MNAANQSGKIIQFSDFAQQKRSIWVSITRVIAWTMLSVFLLTSCTSVPKNPFPDVTQPSAESSIETTETEPDVSSSDDTDLNPTVIKVAAPISSSTANYLAKLYTAKKNHLLGVGITGLNISLETLDSYSQEFSVEILQTPSSGVTVDTIALWKENGSVPDIIYTKALFSMQNSGDIVPLTDYVASNALFLPGNISPTMLNSCSINSELYGIPYAATAQVLFMNMDVFKKAGIEDVPFRLNLDMLLSLSEDVRMLSSQSSPIEELNLAFYKATELFPFLPSSFSSSSGWFTFNGSEYDFRSPSFEQTVQYLRSYVDAGYSYESLSAEDQEMSFASLDPRLSNRVAMWVGNTEEVSLWTTNTTYELSITQIPAETDDTESVPALTVYPLCVSSESENAQLASDFAAFIALDEDAVLLSARLEARDGYLPVISSSSVWNTVMSKQTFGAELLQFKNQMSTAYYNPITNHETDSMLIELIQNEYSPMLLDMDTDIQILIPMLSSAQLAS